VVLNPLIISIHSLKALSVTAHLMKKGSAKLNVTILAIQTKKQLKLSDYLLSNQQHPIFDRASPTQTDIKNHISKNIL
jgi:hypothetical protein